MSKPAVAPFQPAKPTSVNWVRIIVVLVLALIILKACGSIFDDSGRDVSSSATATEPAEQTASQETQDAPAAAPAPAPRVILDTTPAQLYWLYAKNEVRADDQFKGKLIQVTAPVQSIDKDFSDSVVLRFATGVPYEDFGAKLTDDQKPAAAALNVGQSVTVQCPKISRIMNSPYARDCVLVANPAPAASS